MTENGHRPAHGSDLMRVERFADVASFLEAAGGFLGAREAEHNLLYGICSQLRADPSQYEAVPYLAVVDHGGRIVGAALRTPPWRLVVSELDHPAAAHRFADDLAGTDLPGVVGTSRAAGHFAEAWSERTGALRRVSTHERAYRLTAVTAPRPVSGRMVRGSTEHREVLIDWLRAFHEEAFSPEQGRPQQDYAAMADRGIEGRGRTWWLWVDGGRPVSLTGVGGETPHGTRVGPVYTPPELRGRGYASNLVAEASLRALAAGRQFVFLFTDLANPTANHVYQAIGYEPVCDIDEWAFDPATA